MESNQQNQIGHTKIEIISIENEILSLLRIQQKTEKTAEKEMIN